MGLGSCQENPPSKATEEDEIVGHIGGRGPIVTVGVSLLGQRQQLPQQGICVDDA
jgi:hypothetical protein